MAASAAVSPLDLHRLQQALALAESAIGLSDPNPRVGCVVGRDDGSLLGRGYTQAAGQAHAEVMALRDAAGAGLEVAGATAWVTLEPCSHHGRTPPCCDALLAAGIGRVVIAVADPYPEVAGRGVARLRAAGVEVVLADPAEPAQAALVEAAREINIGFFSRHERGRPWVRLKLAATLDGRTALPGGESRWITGQEARRDVHGWRRRSGAVLTGIGTALADDPRLDVREVPSVLQPLRVVMDPRARLGPAAALLAGPGRALVLHGPDADPAALAALVARGAEVQPVPVDAAGRLVPAAALALLADRSINEVHVEAGAVLSAAWIRAGLVDELLLYLAPVLMGPGRGLVDWPVLPGLSQMPRFSVHEHARVGADLRLRLRPAAP